MPAKSKTPAKAKASGAAKKPMTEAELEKLAKKILADPNTAQIAEKLNVPLEEYVQNVMAYYVDPSAEPEFVTISDENLKRMGAPPPKPEDIAAYLQQLTDQKFGRAKSTFDSSKPSAKQVALKPEATELPETQGNDEELKRRVKRGGGKV